MRSAQRRAGVWLGLLAGLAAPAVFAAPPATGPGANQQLQVSAAPVSPAVQKLRRQFGSQMLAGQYEDALATLDDLDKLTPNDGQVEFNRARCLAQMGRSKDALDALDKTIDEAGADANRIAGDRYLQSLHSDPRFSELLAKSLKQEDAAYARFPYEADTNIDGVKAVEGNPSGALRYRILMDPSATSANPDRLLVWFHPTGASMNATLEALAPQLIAHHVALMVFTQKDFASWSAADESRVFGSLQDAAKIPGIDLQSKPLALGLSAGGQMEMLMYLQHPGMFAGWAFDVAYPVDLSASPPKPMETPPADPAVQHEPILAIYGSKDPLSDVWGFVAEGWHKAGVPLKVVAVPNRGHEWLFDSDARKKLLLEWVDQVLTGQVASGGADAATQPAADAPASQPAEEALTPEERAQKVQTGFKQLVQQMQGKDWTDALTTVEQLEKLAPKNGDIIYNKACILARLGKKQDALDALSQSIDAGFVDADHIKTDDDLASLHDDPQFDTLVAKAAKSATDYSRFPYEKGADMPDVKTVEGDPPGGLRYRIRMSKTATAAHPDRLVIWFHPSGGSMDDVVEALAPDLAKHHLALVVFTQKGYMNWTSADVNRMNKSLESIGKIAEINSKKPIGLGFSAGGQMMLMIYDVDPGQFGGMVLDAAYPVQATPTGQLTIQSAPPNDPAIKKTPMLVFVGGDDGGSQVWKMVGDNWRAKGVPLTVNTIPNRKHEWLIDTDDRQKALIDWLDAVNAGKLPGAGAPATQPGVPEQQPQ